MPGFWRAGRRSPWRWSPSLSLCAGRLARQRATSSSSATWWSQYILLATAWNLLGGYAGYINFGTAAFFALGAYVSVALNKLVDLPLPVLILAGGVAGGRGRPGHGIPDPASLRGVFFSIATLALAIVAQAVITNWEFVGGASRRLRAAAERGAVGRQLRRVSLLRHAGHGGRRGGDGARPSSVRRSGYGLSAIRDDEAVAEAYGVPTLRLKLMVTVLSGALMGMAGAPLPFYVAYLDPPSAFNLSYAVNTIAMPLIGGTGTWIGPVIGAVLLTMRAADGHGHHLVGLQPDAGRGS